MKRREVKDAHENAVLENFAKYNDSLKKTMKIIDRPEPPDARVIIDGVETWIEITDAFFNSELAESTTSYLADDKEHRQVPKEKHFSIEPDEQYSDILRKTIIKKYDKNSIGKVYKQYGKGILLVGVINPFLDTRKLVITEKQKIIDAINTKEQRFNEIYLYDVHDHTFHKVL